MEDYITRQEHNEFAKRIDDENTRQNKRLSSLEENVKEIQLLTRSVDRLATSTEAMAKELSRQGERLDTIEKEPAEKWNKAAWIVISVVITAVATFLLARIGL